MRTPCCAQAMPLLVACSKGRADAALTLIRAGADVHAVHGHQSTALGYARGKGLREVVEELRARGGGDAASDSDDDD